MLGGTALAGCKTTTNTGAGATILTQPPTSGADTNSGGASTLPVDTIAPPTTDGRNNSAEAIVWRLSTRNQRSPCAACKAHAAHRFFVSDVTADGGRAHAGCSCQVRAQRTTVGEFQTMFAEGDAVFDDRWT